MQGSRVSVFVCVGQGVLCYLEAHQPKSLAYIAMIL